MTSRMCRCQLVTVGDADVSVCKGDVLVGEPCDDGNVCSAEDKCVSVTPTSPFDNGARCRGTIPSGLPCDDYNACTDEDVCSEVPAKGEFDTAFKCRGTLLAGQPCTPFSRVPGFECKFPCFFQEDCRTNYTCQSFDFEGDTFSVCRGVPNPGIACDDSNECTTDDICVLGENGILAFCQGSPAPGTPCSDGNTCTEDDACVLEAGDGRGSAFCQSGPPLPAGTPCSAFDPSVPSTGGVCVTDDYFGAFCDGDVAILPASAPL
jgi:hypothetical protein